VSTLERSFQLGKNIVNSVISKNKNRLRVIRWCKEHPEEKKLIARNWVYHHPEQHKASVKSWRRRNPDKVKAQNLRARKIQRTKKTKKLYLQGVYTEIKWKITCPKCNRTFKTKAKRPSCQCGYMFPRKYMQIFIDNTKTTPCVCCGREIPFQDARALRKYCNSCFPQIMALKNAIQQMRAKKTDSNKWYREHEEIVVAVTCIFCDTIIPGRRGKKICDDCQTKWQRTIPARVLDDERFWYSFKELPLDLLAWRRIINYRQHGVYKLD